ncbi:Rha family transcriptional regulator [Enterococcus gilvus]|uniref:Rha family transcriptional regulator n=1 Tax=Enterococcus gilvus TaxID=160453 RepID=UPI00345E842A
MNQLEQTINSVEVAGMVGRDHSKVIRDIRGLVEHLAEAKIGVGNYFIESTYKDANNQERPCFECTKKGCELYSTRMTGAKGTQFAVAYIERFNQMEERIKQQPKIATTQREQVILALQANEETNQRVDELDTRVADLEENTVLSAGDYGYISRRINQRVAEVARGFGRLTQEQRGKLYKDINSGVKAVTGVSTRTQLRNRHYETVLDFINDWEPSTATKMQVRQMSLDFEIA